MSFLIITQVISYSSIVSWGIKSDRSLNSQIVEVKRFIAVWFHKFNLLLASKCCLVDESFFIYTRRPGVPLRMNYNRCLNKGNVLVRMSGKKKKKKVWGSCSWYSLQVLSSRLSDKPLTAASVSVRITQRTSLLLLLVETSHNLSKNGGHQEENADAEAG